MARGFTPIIGLAVVVALALAAVFGAMSLSTNPAFAAPGQPADSQLTERVDAPVMVKDGADTALYFYVGTTGTGRTITFADFFESKSSVENGVQFGDASYRTVVSGDSGITNITPGTTVLTSTSAEVPDEVSAKGTQTFAVTAWQSQTANSDGDTINTAALCTGAGGTWYTATATGTPVTANSCYYNATHTFTVNVSDVVLTASSDTPGKAARYTLKYKAKRAVPALDGQTKLEMADFGVPGSISKSSIVVRASNAFVDSPNDIEADDEEIILHIGDLNPADTGDNHSRGIEVNDHVTLTIQSSAGVTLPTEGGKYSWKVQGEGDTNEVMVSRKLTLDEEEGGLGDTIEATVKGFKNGTTVLVFRDGNKNGTLESSDDVLCAVPNLPSSDAGSCTFTVNHPTFTGGENKLGAVDGRNNIADTANSFTLEESIAVTPAGGSPGELLLVQMVDFPASTPVAKVELSRMPVCDGDASTPVGACNGTTDATGSGSINVTIPNWAKAGAQELRIHVGGKNASTNVVISGPQVQVTPGSVVANQRVSLVGVGFTAGAVIGSSGANSKIVIGGETINWSRVNGNQPVTVDNGGNWSAAVDLPLSEATTAEGDRLIQVTDSNMRTGAVTVSVAPRTISITPASGRVGTVATVRGENFPSKNDEGSSFNIAIIYNAGNDKTTQVSVIPDASGRFETQMRIPTTASIPSTNTVRAEFVDDKNITVTTTVSHDVPEGAISLSKTSGSPGSSVTVMGEGFKSYVPVKSVMVGALEVTPAPRPSTDSQGMMEFDITIPGLDNGIQTVEVIVGQTTASTGFTVMPSGVSAGDITPAAEAVENLGDNFVVAWHFNNDTKSWSFYDGMEGSDLDNLITGESYLIQVAATVEVILNNDTRNLTCVGDNCWNQIVW